MSFELDITKIKALKEANPLFKPADDATLANRKGTLEGNYPAILAALYAMKITTVIIHFAGSGDSGEVEEVEFFSGKKKVAEPTLENRTAGDLLDNLTELIEGDWYNNDGGQGTITVDTKTRHVVIEVGYNYMETDHRVEEHQL